MNDKLELDIPVLLPDLPDAADACLDRLVSTLSKREGVERAHVICLDGNTPAALCIHFDAAKLPLLRPCDLAGDGDQPRTSGAHGQRCAVRLARRGPGKRQHQRDCPGRI